MAIDLRPYISVDIEASGPIPAVYSMLALGACSVADLELSFYAELKPSSQRVEPSAMAVHGLSLDDLERRGESPETAMQRFEAWIVGLVPAGRKPIFVSYNAPFDWMFINDAFHRALGRNPFGHAPLDLRALYMGQSGADWSSIRMEDLLDRHLQGRRLTHNALEDARDQAALFRALVSNSIEGEPTQC
jgi:DNA polymerase III epsilon subunit-like protein